MNPVDEHDKVLDEGSPLAILGQELRARYGDSLLGIYLYGSCLRSGDYFDGLVDLYLVVDSYKAAYGNWRLAIVNRLLPPNVFYVEVDCKGRKLRSKYSLISSRHLVTNTSPTHFESYFWGRFSQPMAVIYARENGDQEVLETILKNARYTFLSRALPGLPTVGTVDALWQQGLALSYGTELRAERSGRGKILVDSNRAFFERATEEFAASYPELIGIRQENDDVYYETNFSNRQRNLASLAWKLRRPWGKFLSVCRVLKAGFTFQGGLDYLIWKLERHSGQKIEIPDKVRRYPWIYVWPLFWRLYRRGVFK